LIDIGGCLDLILDSFDVFGEFRFLVRVRQIMSDWF